MTDLSFNKVLTRTLAVFTLLCVGVAGGWAASVLLRPVADPTVTFPYTFAVAEQGAVESSISLNVRAAWDSELAGTNRATGTVTSVDLEQGAVADVGDVLYFADLRPVVVASGSVPAFRSISEGSVGADVSQLQDMLRARGFYSSASDGKAQTRTVEALKRWQRSVGHEETGVLEIGDVVFVPQLPARLTLDLSILRRGGTLSGGEDVVRALPVAPTFTLPVTTSQASAISSGTAVAVSAPDGGEWIAVTGEQTVDEQGQTVTITLHGADGVDICRDACGSIPVTGESQLTARIVTVPRTQGVVVPASALTTGTDGAVGIVTDDGSTVSVTVIATARGMAVVEGVREGTRVRVPGS